MLYSSPEFVIERKGSAPDPASGQESIPDKFQPFFQTPGIVLPQKGNDDVTNTTASSNTTEGALPKLDGSADSFKDFHPVQHGADANASRRMTVWSDLMFVVVLAAFTALVVTS